MALGLTVWRGSALLCLVLLRALLLAADCFLAGTVLLTFLAVLASSAASASLAALAVTEAPVAADAVAEDEADDGVAAEAG